MRVTGILDFLDVTAAAAFDVPPAQAIAYFQGKGLRATFSYADMLRDEHRIAFTIAKMMDIDLLKDVQDSLDMALSDGIPFSEWKKQIIPVLQAKGWWGKADMIDPLTGELKRVTLGTPHRLATIFRTNMQASYAVGAWEQIEAQAEDAPYLMYDAVDDFRTRPAHRAWDGKVIRWDDKWWRTHYPPNGFNCRCSVIQLDEADLEGMGLTVEKAPRNRLEDWRNPRTGQVERIPEGIDPGFDHNPGQRRMEELAQLQAEKIKTLPADMRESAREGVKKALAAANATKAADMLPKPAPAAPDTPAHFGYQPGDVLVDKWGDKATFVSVSPDDQNKIIVMEGKSRITAPAANYRSTAKKSAQKKSAAVAVAEDPPKVFYHYSYSSDVINVDEGKGRFGGLFALESKEAAAAYGKYGHKFEVFGRIFSNQDFADEVDNNMAKVKKFIREYLGLNRLSADDAEDIIWLVKDEYRAIGSEPPNGSMENIMGLMKAVDDSDLYAEAQKLRGAIARDLGASGIHMNDEFGSDSVLLVSRKNVRHDESFFSGVARRE